MKVTIEIKTQAGGTRPSVQIAAQLAILLKQLEEFDHPANRAVLPVTFQATQTCTIKYNEGSV